MITGKNATHVIMDEVRMKVPQIKLKTKALFIGGGKPELAFAVAKRHDKLDVECADRLEFNLYWKDHHDHAVHAFPGASHMFTSDFLERNQLNYDAAYLLDPTPDLVQKATEFVKHGCPVMDAHGNFLAERKAAA